MGLEQHPRLSSDHPERPRPGHRRRHGFHRHARPAHPRARRAVPAIAGNGAPGYAVALVRAGLEPVFGLVFRVRPAPALFQQSYIRLEGELPVFGDRRDIADPLVEPATGFRQRQRRGGAQGQGGGPAFAGPVDHGRHGGALDRLRRIHLFPGMRAN